MRVTVAVALWATQRACSPRQSASYSEAATEFANRFTGSEYFQWVRRSGENKALPRQRGMIASKFVERAKTTLKVLISTFRWES